MSLVRTLIVFVLVDLSLRIAGVHRTLRMINRITEKRLHDQNSDESGIVADACSAVERATACYLRTQKDCLPRSLALYGLLRANGVRGVFCLGVKRFPFAGHAWVEWNAKILNDEPARVLPYTLLMKVGQ